jgi:hypothetical protein
MVHLAQYQVAKHVVESVDEKQLPLFEVAKCMSAYNLCE